MNLKFDNVSILGINYENNTFNTDYTFSTKKNISIQGKFLDLQNSTGVTGTILDMEKFLVGSSSIIGNEKDIYINGQILGEGYVESFSVDGEFIRDADYNASVVIEESSSITEIILSQNKDNEYRILSGIQEEDLKYLSSIQENFDFKKSESGESQLAHSFSCSFLEKRSLMPNSNDIWNNASISGQKNINLNNKGKGSILIDSGNVSTYTQELDAGNYVLIFEYLGQDDIRGNWGDTTVSVGSQSLTISEKKYQNKRIKFTNGFTQNVTISITANTSNNTYYDNFKLFLEEDLPINKSRNLANFFLNLSNNYPIIETDQSIQGELHSYQDVEYNESFDYESNSYSKTKSISILPVVDQDKNYSTSNDISITMSESGEVNVEQSSKIKILKNKSVNNLKSFVEEVINNSLDNCTNILNDFYFKLNEYHHTPTETSTNFKTSSLKAIPLSKKINYDFQNFEADINISYTDNESYHIGTENFSIVQQANIGIHAGIYSLDLSGTVQGDGDGLGDKIIAAQKGFELVDINSQAEANVSLQKINENNVVFYLVNKSFKINDESGSINYSYKYSSSLGEQVFEDNGKKISSNHSININESDESEIYNEFILNGKTVAFKNGYNPKRIGVSLSSLAKHNVREKELCDAAKSIINSTGYYPNSVDLNFITEQSFSFNEYTKRFSYNIQYFDFTENLYCDSNYIPVTPTVIYGNPFPVQPIPTRVSYEDINYIPETKTLISIIPETYFDTVPTELLYDPAQPTETGTQTYVIQCLDDVTEITVVDSQYSFDGNDYSDDSRIGVGIGEYTIVNNNTDHPIGFVDNSRTITVIEGTSVYSEYRYGGVVSYYTGTIKVRVSGDFGITRYRCMNHPSMDQERLVFSDNCSLNNYTPTETETETETGAEVIPTETITITEIETITETETYDPCQTYNILVPENWSNQKIGDLFPDGQLVVGYQCFDEGSSVGLLAPSPMGNSFKAQEVNYCNQSTNSSQRWHSFDFITCEQEIPPTKTAEDWSSCNIYSVDIPKFWEGTIADIVNNENISQGQFLGGYRTTGGSFEYSNTSASGSVSINSELINIVEYDVYHPKYDPDSNNVNAEFFSGPLVFQTCLSSIEHHYELYEIITQFSNIKTIQDLIVEGFNAGQFNWSQGMCIEIIGVNDCNGSERFNNPVHGTDPTLAEVVSKNSVVEHCDENSLGLQLISVYIKIYSSSSCNSTDIESSIL